VYLEEEQGGEMERGGEVVFRQEMRKVFIIYFVFFIVILLSYLLWLAQVYKNVTKWLKLMYFLLCDYNLGLASECLILEKKNM
jgi:hypothetical protein